ncbi:MAG: branched-chain amino acid ABC transporter permease [Chloroflexi bacterium]|nr:branched-chain amino acid ABC transporter permease [Chloroflexota bacterium]
MDTTRAFTPRKLLIQGLLLLFLIFLATFPSYGLPTYYVVLFVTFFLYVILAVSWATFSGPTGYMSLAPAAFLGVGTYTTTILYGLLKTKVFSTLPVDVLQPAVNMFLVGAVVAGALVCFVFALLIGLVTLRLKEVYFTIFTFGLIVFIYQLVLFLEIHLTGTRGRSLILPGTGAPLCSTTTVYYVLLGIVVATLLAAYFIRRSKLGLAMQSIGGNEEAAAHMGVDTTRVKVLSFAISAAFMGAAGAIWAARLIYVDPGIAFDMLYSFVPVLMAIFGGIGQLYGPVIGAVIFAYIQRILMTELPKYYMLVFGGTLIICVLFLPGGLVGLIPTLRNRLGGVISKFWKGGQAEQRANT